MSFLAALPYNSLPSVVIPPFKVWVRVLLVVWVGLVLAGCADTKGIFRYVEPRDHMYWPQEPEIPRFQYIGQLTGEDNFQEVESGAKAKFMTVLRWVVGLFSEDRERILLQRPQSGVTAEDGSVFVTDVSRQAVYVFDQVTGRVQVWEGVGPERHFVAPIGVTLGAGDEILVADAELGEVIRLDRKGDLRGTFGKDVLKRPTGIARDPVRGRIFVSDTRAHDIKVFSEQGELLDVLGRPGTGLGEFNGPTHMAFAQNQLYITDSLNSRVQVLNAEGDFIREFGRRGLFVGNLPHPKGVAADSNGNVYVVESYYDHLLVYSPDGEFLLPLGGSGMDIGQFYLPAGVWVDRNDRVYVADMFNGRVVVFQGLGGSAE